MTAEQTRTVRDFTTKDSGEREMFSTGAHRDTRSGKGRFDLLPVFALERDACLLERGAEKYDARNWEQGFQFSRCLDSAIRHLVLHLQGESVEDHLAAARFNIACVMHYEEMIHRGLMDSALNDLPNYSPVLPSTVSMPNEEAHSVRPTNTPDVSDGLTDYRRRALFDVSVGADLHLGADALAYIGVLERQVAELRAAEPTGPTTPAAVTAWREVYMQEIATLRARIIELEAADESEVPNGAGDK